MPHVRGRDDASPADIKERPWKEKWCHYARVHHAEFLNGTMGDGISLNDMMSELKSDSFVATQRNAMKGKGNTNPRTAYRQQAAVQLSDVGRAWIDERLQNAFERIGMIPASELAKLDWPVVDGTVVKAATDK